MSSVSSEVLEDVLRPLDRWTLDDVQFTSRRFLQVILERMSDVCLRPVSRAYFAVPPEYATKDRSSFRIHVDGRRTRRNIRKDTARLFSQFMQALRSSRVASLTLIRLVFTPDNAALILQTPIVAGNLDLDEGRCAERTPAQFRDIVLHFSPTSLGINSCHLRACQITDDFLRALSKNGVRRVLFPYTAPLDGGIYCVTDDAIVDFCLQQDVPIDQEDDEHELSPCEALELHNGRFTKDLFKRLVEASSVSMRTQPLRISVFPVPVEDADLRDFAQHLSERYRGTPRHLRIYNFPGEQHGAVAGIHLQIVLHTVGKFEMVRARRPNRFFYKPGA